MGRCRNPGDGTGISIEVKDLESFVVTLRQSGAHFRNDIVRGVGGNQIIVEDPSGNPIELFQPVRQEARLGPDR